MLKFCEIFHKEIVKLKAVYGYPKSFVDFCIRKYSDNIFIKKKLVLKASKKELIYVLPFTGKKSLQLRTCLVNSTESNIKFCKLKVIFQSPHKLDSMFRYKDSLKKKFSFDIVYRYTRSNWKLTYYGNTYRDVFTRVFTVTVGYTLIISIF